MTNVTDRLEPIHHVYHGFDRKLCELRLDDGTWVSAEIRAWDRHEHGAWSAAVAWTRGPGRSSSLDRFAGERVRAVRIEPGDARA